MKFISTATSRTTRAAIALGLVLPTAIFICICIGTGVGFGVPSSSSTSGSISTANERPYCGPDGNIWQGGVSSNTITGNGLWTPTLFLTVDLGFGALTFGQAKAIDVAFDLIIGRGAQLLLALLAYPILRHSLMRSLEYRGMSFRLIFSLLLEKVSITSLWELILSSWRTPPVEGHLKPRWKWMINWRLPLIALVILHILLTPSFLSAATSYQALSHVLVPLPNSLDLAPFDNFTLALAVIDDASRIGLSEPYGVIETDAIFQAISGYSDGSGLIGRWFFQNTSASVSTSPNKSRSCDWVGGDRPVSLSLIDENHKPPQWSFHINVTEALERCNSASFEPGFKSASDILFEAGRNGTNSSILVQGTARNVTPPLSIYWQNVQDSDAHQNRAYGEGDPYWVFQNMSIENSYLLANGTCQPTNQYQWGCSSLMLFTYCVASCVAGLLLLILQWDAWWNSSTTRFQNSISKFRDVLDLASELRIQYGEHVTSMPAKNLETLVKNRPFRVDLEFEEPPVAMKTMLPAIRRRKRKYTDHPFAGISDDVTSFIHRTDDPLDTSKRSKQRYANIDELR